MERAVVAVVVALLLLSAPRAAAQTPQTPAPTCGQAPTGGSAGTRPATATLSLDGQSQDPVLVNDASFGRKTGTRKLTLVYNVTGCDMADTESPPQDPPRIYPPKSGDSVPDGVVVLDGDPDIDGSRYIVHLKASSGAFDPGSYGGGVEIKAAWLNTVTSPVTVSRSENRRWVPALWGVVGALGGFGLFAGTRFLDKDNLQVPAVGVVFVLVVSVIAGVVAAYTTSYLNQDVWVSGDNGWAALVVGFTGSTSGVIASLLGAVWKTRSAQSTTSAGGKGETGADGRGG